MRISVATSHFEKDVRLLERRGKDMEKLTTVLSVLGSGKTLDPIHRDHRLVGSWTGCRECHLESDWLLIYKVEPNRIILVRTGSHADLFKL